MLTTEAIGLSIKLSKGLIKLANRVDKVMAEKSAVTSPIALPQSVNQLLPKQGPMIKALKALLREEPDLPATDRNRIQKVLDSNGGNPETAPLRRLMKTYLPEQARGRILDLDGQFMTAVRNAGLAVDDPDVRVSLFYVKAELSEDEKGYSWRIALTVVDVLAEFGEQNVGLFVRDEKVQGVVAAVLARFGQANLQTADTWSGLLRKALSATLNGALDARGVFDVDSELLGAVLDGLQSARAQMPAAQRDNFLLGLLQGAGYPLLVGTLVETAAEELGAEGASAFEKIAADVLKAGAKLVKNEPGFEEFFRDNWGHLVRAGFGSLKVHGPSLVGDKPLASGIVVAISGRLAETEDRSLLTSATLVGLVDTAIGAVAARPDVLAGAAGKAWLGELVSSVVQTVADQGVRETFSSDGAADILTGAFATFGANPRLIVEHPGLIQELVGGVLTGVSGIDRLSATQLANAAVGGALATIAANPALLDVEYPELVAGFAGKVAELVEGSSITGIQGEALLSALTVAVAENPKLLVDLERNLGESVIGVVLEVAGDDPTRLFVGAALAETVQGILQALAQHGRAMFESGALDDAITQLESLLRAGLARVQSELGNRMSLGSVPKVLAELVAAWARGEVGEIDANNPNFKRLFGELAARAAA